MNPRGPAGECLNAAELGECILHISPFVISEIQALPAKLDQRFGVTIQVVDVLINRIREFAVHIVDVPVTFEYLRDPKDAAYINLAIVTQSRLVVSRDRHLLDLTDPSRQDAGDFLLRFPELRVVTPVAFLQELGRRR